ncbi:hypothetical protein V6N12_074427 [Hibiscus sabdariffa]|uniref:Ribosomal protein L32 n=1 Tax=Hibiscus sabdariffa TaxID=183260 RepID=A0ABR2BLI2_9ROSI
MRTTKPKTLSKQWKSIRKNNKRNYQRPYSYGTKATPVHSTVPAPPPLSLGYRFLCANKILTDFPFFQRFLGSFFKGLVKSNCQGHFFAY